MLNQIIASGTLVHLVLLLPQIWNGLFFLEDTLGPLFWGNGNSDI